MLKRKIHAWGRYLPLLFLALLPLLWYRRDFLLTFEESAYLNYTFVFEKYLSLWSPHLNNGYTHFWYPLIFPQALYWKGLTLLHLSPLVIQKSFFCLVWGAIVTFTYKLLRKITKDHWASVTGTALYLLNFYVFSTIFYTAKTFQLFLLPAIFWFTLNYLTTRKPKWLFINTAVIFFCQGLFTNLPQTIVTLVAYPAALVLALVKKNQPVFSVIKRFACLLTMAAPIVILNLWVYTLNYSAEELETTLASNTFEALDAPLSKVLQFRGAWWEEWEFAGIPYNHLRAFFENRFVVVVSYVIFGSGLLAFVKRRFKKEDFYWLFLLIFFIFLAKGTAPPLGAGFAFLYSRSPYLKIFREPWAKFMPWVILVTTVLAAKGLARLNRCRRQVSVPISLLFFGLIIIRGWPFLNGQILDHNNQGWKKTDVRIPSYWYEAQKWSRENKQATLFLLPQPLETTKDFYFNWYPELAGNYKGPLPYYLLYSNIQLNTNADGFWSRSPRLASQVRYFNPRSLWMLNTTYVLNIKDIQPSGFNDLALNQVADLLVEEPVASFGQKNLTLYALKEAACGLLYQTSSVINYYGDEKGLAAAVALEQPPTPFVVRSSPSYSTLKENQPLLISILTSERNPPAPLPPDLQQKEALPETSLSPESPLHRLVIAKEHLEQLLKLGPRDRADGLLWLSAKRLKELSLANQEETKDKLAQLFCQQIELVQTLLTDHPEDQGLKEKVLEYQPLISKLLPPSQDLACWNELNSKSECWQTEAQGGCPYCAEFKVPLPGEYEIFLEPDGQPPIAYYLDGQKYKPEPEGSNKKLGAAQLDQGLHSLQLELPLTPSIATALLETLPPGTYTFPDYMDLQKNNDQPLLAQSLNDWKPNTRYEVTVTYRGYPQFILLEAVVAWESAEGQNTSKANLPSQTLFTSKLNLPKAEEWQTVAFQVASNPSSLQGRVLFAKRDQTTPLEIGKIEVREVAPRQRLVLRRAAESLTKPTVESSSLITYRQTGPNRYQITIPPSSESQRLVFSQSFHSGWQLEPLRGGSVTVSDHFLANGYANGWQIGAHPHEQASLQLDFRPERTYRWLLALSVGSALLSLAGLFCTWFRKKDDA